MRPVRGALVTLFSWMVAAIGRADAAPEPGRPEWHDTPLPMPADPSPELWVVAAAALMMVGLLWLRRGLA
ncbi:MAG: hypothetical protein AB8I08_38310 [Sandaracinaceae bacterium]